jgi:hypothetical protein
MHLYGIVNEIETSEARQMCENFCKANRGSSLDVERSYQCRDAVRRSVARFAVTPRNRSRNTIGSAPPRSGGARRDLGDSCTADWTCANAGINRADDSAYHRLPGRCLLDVAASIFWIGPLHSTLGYWQMHADFGAFIVGECRGINARARPLQRALYDKLSHSFAVSASEAQTAQPVAVRVFSAGSAIPP